MDKNSTQMTPDNLSGQMVRKVVFWTFCITWIMGFGVILANQFGYLRAGTLLYWIVFLTGASSAEITVFFIFTKNKIMPAKQYFRTVFALKQPVRMYLLVFGFVVVYFGVGLLTGIFEFDGFNWFSLYSIPFMVLAGGLEELGWRWVLNPALEKKMPFAAACLITAVIWSAWHIPVFMIEGSEQSHMNFFIFSIAQVGLSFAYAAIYRISKSVWLCVFIHALNNSLYSSFIMHVDDFGKAAAPSTIVSIALIIVSLIAVKNADTLRGKAA